jgi:hypothetical protein
MKASASPKLTVLLITTLVSCIGVFASASQLSGVCIGQPGFSCSYAVINTSGTLSFALGQGMGATLYNTKFACVSSDNSTSPTSFKWGVPSGYIASGQSLTIAGLTCYGANGPFGPQSVGTTFTGYIWTSYTTNSSPTSPTYYVKIGTTSEDVVATTFTITTTQPTTSTLYYTSTVPSTTVPATTTLTVPSTSLSTTPTTTTPYAPTTITPNSTTYTTTISVTKTSYTTTITRISTSASTTRTTTASTSVASISSLKPTTTVQQSTTTIGQGGFIQGIINFFKNLFSGL